MLAVPRLVVAPCPRSVVGTSNISSSGRPASRTSSETVYETQQVTCVRDVCETVMQPQDDHDDPDGRRAVRPRRPLHRPAPVLPDGHARVPLHGPAAGLADDLEDVHVHGLPAGPRDAHGDPDVHGLPAGPRDRPEDRACTTSATPVREVTLQGVLLHGLPAGAGDLRQDGPVHRLPAGPARPATRPARTPSAGRCRRPATGRSPTRCRCRCSRRSCSASRTPQMVPVQQCALQAGGVHRLPAGPRDGHAGPAATRSDARAAGP